MRKTTRIARLTIMAGLFAGLLPGQPASAWRSLFDGKSLAGWKESDFFGAGKVTLENGVITLGSGALTGINWAAVSAPFPTSNYEVRIEAARIKGSDFFAGRHGIFQIDDDGVRTGGQRLVEAIRSAGRNVQV